MGERNLLQKQLSNLEKKSKMQEETILTFNEKFARKNDQCKTLKQTLDRFTLENQSQKDLIRELEKENRKLQNDESKSKSHKRAADLENQLNQKKNYIDMLKATLLQKEKENDDLSKQRNDLKLENGRLQKSLNMGEDWGGEKQTKNVIPISPRIVEPVKKKKKKKPKEK